MPGLVRLKQRRWESRRCEGRCIRRMLPGRRIRRFVVPAVPVVLMVRAVSVPARAGRAVSNRKRETGSPAGRRVPARAGAAGGHSGGVPQAVTRAGCRRRPLGRGAAGGDRKSTRLNSSHITISYAVFCLKKKKKKKK